MKYSDAQLSIGDVTVEARSDDFVQYHGHKLVENGDGIKCRDCEVEENIPDIFLQSSGFRLVTYKLYVLGRFKRRQCEQVLGLQPTGRTVEIAGRRFQQTQTGAWQDEIGNTYSNKEIVELKYGHRKSEKANRQDTSGTTTEPEKTNFTERIRERVGL